MDFYFLGDPKLGIKVYKNTIQKKDDIPARLHLALDNSSHEYFRWHDSLVGEGVKMPDYRDCVDFKMDESYIKNTPGEFEDIVNIYDIVSKAQKQCLREYESNYNIHMKYMEAINFVKYGPNQHFSIHTDHGFSYICTVSCVTYLNEEYEGGELYFPYLDLEFKPEFGDSVFFPSTYIFAHASKPVKSGLKYSAVTMFDYNDDAHKHGGFSRDFGQKNDQPYKPSVSYSQDTAHAQNEQAAISESRIRQIAQEEVQKYAMQSWEYWQNNSANNNPFSVGVTK